MRTVVVLGVLKKTEHPLANLRAVQGFLEDLPRNDALKALQEITAWMESARDMSGFRVDHQLAVLRLFDEAARQFERKLAREYFSSATLAAFHENRLWMALNDFSTQALLGYLMVHVRYRNGDKGASAIKGSLPLVAARGINAATGMLKMAAARYALFDQAIWKGLAEFYSHAESENYLDQPVMLFQGGGETSVRGELASTLMWYASSSGSLSRSYLHLAERLVAHLQKNLTLSAQPGANSRFVFDLQHPMSPMRVSAGATAQPSLLYLGVEGIGPRIDALLKALEKNAVPDELNLGGAFEAGAVRAALQHLAECLASPPPVRRNARRNIKVSLSVTRGLADVMEQTDIGLNFGGTASATWQAEDISLSGLRCVLSPASKEKVDIGMLIGIRPENVERWGAGIVRRISRDSKSHLHVGIEMISNQLSGVNLREEGADEERPALWLDSTGGDPGEVDILMSLDTFVAGRSLHARVADKSYLLMPLRLLEKGADYELARYRKVEREAATDEEETG